MKTFNFKTSLLSGSVVILLIALSVTSCNANREDSKRKLTEKEMSAIIKKHITLKDTLYVVDISRHKANKLGISNEFYDTLIINIKRANKMLKQTLKEKDAVIGITDMKNNKELEIRKGNQQYPTK
jgi:hypothetical protein